MIQAQKIFLTVCTAAFLVSCNTNNKPETTIVKNEKATDKETISFTESEIVINETIKAHGGDLYKSAHISFDFRDKNYQFKNDGLKHEYIRTFKENGTVIKDVFKNGAFSRTVDGELVELTEKVKTSGGEAINSVIYFATLPYKLSDKAVNSELKEGITIFGESYDVVEVTFDQEGGGEDHDDEYYYWVNKATKKIDYLAYNYSVNGGGVRFRSAYNKRVVGGITFQDYINYGAKVGTPLKDLPKLLEANELKELSEIKTENIINLNKQ